MSEASSSEVLMDRWTNASRGSEVVVSVLIVSVVLSLDRWVCTCCDLAVCCGVGL